MANIISQKPRGFYITFRIGKYHSGQSPEYHLLFPGGLTFDVDCTFSFR